MENYLTLLRAARESELEIQAEVEHIERVHKILKIPHRSAEYAANLTEKLTLLERELNDCIDTAYDRKREALACLSVLVGNERTVLYRYYILGEDWRRIADTMFLSERSVFNLRKSALDKLAASAGVHNATGA